MTLADKRLALQKKFLLRAGSRPSGFGVLFIYIWANTRYDEVADRAGDYIR